MPRRRAARCLQRTSEIRAGRQRERQNLELKREQILNTRTSNAHRRASLDAALRDIELQLEALEKQS